MGHDGFEAYLQILLRSLLWGKFWSRVAAQVPAASVNA